MEKVIKVIQGGQFGQSHLLTLPLCQIDLGKEKRMLRSDSLESNLHTGNTAITKGAGATTFLYCFPKLYKLVMNCSLQHDKSHDVYNQ